MTLHIPALVTVPLAHLAAWAQARFPGVGRPVLAGGAVVAGWLAGKIGSQLLAAVGRVAFVGAGLLIGWMLLKGGAA